MLPSAKSIPSLHRTGRIPNFWRTLSLFLLSTYSSAKMKSNQQENRQEFSGEGRKRLLSGDHGRTRDLPKLSECQACGLRFDACTGKNRIRLLYSEWRVLLLCKKCFLLVESSKICSYCFKETSSRKNCVRCCQCGRFVHDACYWDYKTVPPWCYQCSGIDVSVCADCWVPKPIACKRGVLTVKRSSKNASFLEKGDSISRLSIGWDCENLLEDAMNDASSVFGKEVEVTRGRQLGVRKALQENPDSVASVDESCESLQNSDGNVVDDMELAFQLHRAINSSPRISQNNCLLDSPCSSAPRDLFASEGDLIWRLSNARSGDGFRMSEVCTDGNFYENHDDDSGSSAQVRNMNDKILKEVGGVKPRLRVYVRTRWKYGKFMWTAHGGSENMSDGLEKEQDRCSTRWMNVYKRARWKSGICKQDFFVDSEKWRSRIMEGQQIGSTRPMKVYVRNSLKNGKCLQKLSGDVQNSEAISLKVEGMIEGPNEHSTRFMNVYVRTGLKNGKFVHKLSGEFPNGQTKLKDGEGLIDGQQKSSTGFMNVYRRTRLKQVESLLKPSGDFQNAEARSRDGEEDYSTDANDSCMDDLGVYCCHNLDDRAVLKDEPNNEEQDRYSIKYHRRAGSK